MLSSSDLQRAGQAEFRLSLRWAYFFNRLPQGLQRICPSPCTLVILHIVHQAGSALPVPTTSNEVVTLVLFLLLIKRSNIVVKINQSSKTN